MLATDPGSSRFSTSSSSVPPPIESEMPESFLASLQLEWPMRQKGTSGRWLMGNIFEHLLLWEKEVGSLFFLGMDVYI